MPTHIAHSKRLTLDRLVLLCYLDRHHVFAVGAHKLGVFQVPASSIAVNAEFVSQLREIYVGPKRSQLYTYKHVYVKRGSFIHIYIFHKASANLVGGLIW